ATPASVLSPDVCRRTATSTATQWPRATPPARCRLSWPELQGSRRPLSTGRASGFRGRGWAGRSYVKTWLGSRTALPAAQPPVVERPRSATLSQDASGAAVSPDICWHPTTRRPAPHVVRHRRLEGA